MTLRFCDSCTYSGHKPEIIGELNKETDNLLLSVGCLICIFGDHAVKFIASEKE